jgi:hypothetical protein
MVSNANTKTATKVFMARFIEVKYGGIRQISRRKNGSFMSEYPARRARRFIWPLIISSRPRLVLK